MAQALGREVTDSEGTVWNCVQAYAELAEKTDKEDLAKVKGEEAYWVVCTPSGGAQSVRVKLPQDWETACSDEELLATIQANQ
ncbi:hypothetical protein [Leptolyngbya sp. GB1-A1]|uniref:hypothetical protein n=1 Tax=unclassified Leptolyngbya TaxID=2650499 RepID=UPI0032967E04